MQWRSRHYHPEEDRLSFGAPRSQQCEERSIGVLTGNAQSSVGLCLTLRPTSRDMACAILSTCQPTLSNQKPRHSETLGVPAPLRFPAGARRCPLELGRPEGTELRPGRETHAGARRGSPGQLWVRRSLRVAADGLAEQRIGRPWRLRSLRHCAQTRTDYAKGLDVRKLTSNAHSQEPGARPRTTHRRHRRCPISSPEAAGQGRTQAP